MPENPPDISQAGFLRLLDDLLETGLDDPPWMCGSIPCPTVPGEPPELINPPSRLAVQLEGRRFFVISVKGQRVEVELTPGKGIFWSPNSWTIPFFNTVGRMFSVVFLPDRVRLLQVVHTGEMPTRSSPWAYHTALPISGTGTHVLRALNGLTEAANRGPVARELFTVLLRLVRDHLADDVPAVHVHDRALRTWQSARIYVEEHFGRDVSRESVADALGLHPNYLSALATRVGGQPFREVLEGVRMQHARRLLLHTDLKLARIATLCGYRDPVRFGKAFRRVTGITPGRFRARSEFPEQPNS